MTNIEEMQFRELRIERQHVNQLIKELVDKRATIDKNIQKLEDRLHYARYFPFINPGAPERGHHHCPVLGGFITKQEAIEYIENWARQMHPDDWTWGNDPPGDQLVRKQAAGMEFTLGHVDRRLLPEYENLYKEEGK